MNPHRKSFNTFSISAVLMLMVFVSACGGLAGTRGVKFESIEQKAPLAEAPEAPFYVAFIGQPDAQDLQDALPEPSLNTLETLGTSQQDQLILVAFSGVKGSSGYGIEIRRVQVEGETLLITVEETRPDPEDIVEPATTTPYHIVAVPLESLDLTGEVEVVFQDIEGKEIGRLQLNINPSSSY